jgi:hypothetical protein
VTIGQRYLELALRFGGLGPGLIDSYAGPADLAARIQAEGPVPAATVAREAAALRREIESDEPDHARRRWLVAQLDGLQAASDVVAGETIPLRELVQRCYGIEPTLVPEQTFADAHTRLDEELPGRGTLRDRYADWVSTQYVAPGLIAPGLEALAAELRSRTDALFGPLEADLVTFVLVEGEPWQGHCDYQGGLSTRISINTDLPIPAFRLLELVTHEVYPGHHTEHVLKEPLLRNGRLELAVFLYPAPQALVAEGIAELALETALGEDAERIGAEIVEPLGITYDAETTALVRDVKRALLTVRTNLALLLDEGALAEADAYAYAREWMIDSDARVERSVANLLAARWRPYVFCYPLGLDLARRFVGGDPTRFRRLLAEQLTTADLAA